MREHKSAWGREDSQGGLLSGKCAQLSPKRRKASGKRRVPTQSRRATSRAYLMQKAQGSRSTVPGQANLCWDSGLSLSHPELTVLCSSPCSAGGAYQSPLPMITREKQAVIIRRISCAYSSFRHAHFCPLLFFQGASCLALLVLDLIILVSK